MDGLRVGIVGDDDAAAAIEAAGGDPIAGEAADVIGADPDAVVAVGETAIRALAHAGADAPVLPVAADPGLRSVPTDALDAAAEALVDGAYEVASHPVLSVRVNGERAGRALRDASLIAAGPARISEFAVESAAEGAVATVRADGVVVATPAGSQGYAAAGSGPLLAPGTGLAVVPIAPFVTDPDRWVLPADRIDLRIRRDDTPVAVEADGVERATVGADDVVTLVPDGSFPVAVTPESGPTFPG